MSQKMKHGSSATPNPFDSDSDEPSLGSKYSNPFDEGHPHPADKRAISSKNPFDDEASTAGQNPFEVDSIASLRYKTGARVEDEEDISKSRHHRRRGERVRNKVSTISGDLSSKAKSSVNYVQSKAEATAGAAVTAVTASTRSRNLMGAPDRNRQQLLPDTIANESEGAKTRKYANARIDRAVKEGGNSVLEEESVEGLQSYAVHKSKETTAAVYNTLKVAEGIKDGATNISVQLHEQGQQIIRTHETAADIEVHLGRGEKLLGSLGGIFSKTWKPKKSRNITGPMLSRGDSFKRKAYAMEQRAALGLTRSNSKGRRNAAIAADDGNGMSSSSDHFNSRIQAEKGKQDDALSDLSNVIGQIKEMSIDMGDEIRRQNEALGYLESDVGELGYRVKGANERGRKLLGK